MSVCVQQKRYECVGFRNGKCILLDDTNFNGCVCPFFKTKKDAITEKIAVFRRLVEINYFNPFDLTKEQKEMYYLTEAEALFCDSYHIDYSGIPIARNKR